MTSRIRPAKIDDIPSLARIHVETWRSAYAGIIDDSYLEALTYESKAAEWKLGLSSSSAKTQRLLAEYGNDIVGFVIIGAASDQIGHPSAEMYALCVQSDMHGKGIGVDLFNAGTDWRREQGHDQMLIRVLKENSLAIKFYRSRSAVSAAEREIEIGGRSYPEQDLVLAL